MLLQLQLCVPGSLPSRLSTYKGGEEEEQEKRRGEQNSRGSRGRESEYNETERKTLREPLHHTVCQSHRCLPIDQQDCPPLQTGLVLFTEPCLVRPGKSHQLGRSSSLKGQQPVLLKVVSRMTLSTIPNALISL